MEHYRFTNNVGFLNSTAWPIFEAAATFYDCYTYQLQGHTSYRPYVSPDNSIIVSSDESVAGNTTGTDLTPTMDNSLLYAFFSNVLEVASILRISTEDGGVLSRVQGLRNGLCPTLIAIYGGIQEWRFDYEELEPGHRQYLQSLGPLSR
jgi:alpha-L-fucosidase 2